MGKSLTCDTAHQYEQFPSYDLKWNVNTLFETAASQSSQWHSFSDLSREKERHEFKCNLRKSPRFERSQIYMGIRDASPSTFGHETSAITL